MFIVADNVVTLIDREGNPAKDRGGKTYSQKLRDGDDPKIIAGRLTRELREALRGKNALHNNFEREIS